MKPAVRQLLFGSPFTPARLFRAGEQGVWFDCADLSTLFQDSAGTTPVTAVGQPVGKILDKSGRGNHATQATAASRPVLQQDASGYYYLAFDGTDDGMATAAIDSTATDKMTVWVGVYKASDAATALLLESSADSNTNNGAFSLRAPQGAAANFGLGGRGTVNGQVYQTPTNFAAPISSVLAAQFDHGATTVAAQLQMRVNGATQALSVVTAGPTAVGNFTNQPLYIGRRAGTSLPFNGRIYSLIVRGAATDATTLARAERWVGAKQGIAL